MQLVRYSVVGSCQFLRTLGRLGGRGFGGRLDEGGLDSNQNELY